MTDSAQISILRRMAHVPPAPDDAAAMTPSRALRLAFARAAEAGAKLAVTVLGVTDETLPLDEALGRVNEAHLLVGVTGPTGLAGLAALDLQTRAAVVEVVTTGKLFPRPAAERAATGADAALCTPLLTAFLDLLPEFCAGTVLQGWTDGYRIGTRLPDRRAASLQLDDQDYRIVGLTLDFGSSERQGEVLLLLPSHHIDAPAAVDPAAPSRWHDDLAEAVGAAAANLHAVLHRPRLPIREVEAFEVGQIVPLPGVTVNSVRLEAADGSVAARARLGQVSGMRAVRLESAPMPELQDAIGRGQGQGQGQGQGRGAAVMARPGLGIEVEDDIDLSIAAPIDMNDDGDDDGDPPLSLAIAD